MKVCIHKAIYYLCQSCMTNLQKHLISTPLAVVTLDLMTNYAFCGTASENVACWNKLYKCLCRFVMKGLCT